MSDGIGIRRLVDQMTPVTPDGGQIEKYRTIEPFRARESLGTPGPPMDFGRPGWGGAKNETLIGAYLGNVKKWEIQLHVSTSTCVMRRGSGRVTPDP